MVISLITSNNKGWSKWKTNKLREKEEKLLLIEEDEGIITSSVTGKWYNNNVSFVTIFSIFIAVSGSFACGYSFVVLLFVVSRRVLLHGVMSLDISRLALGIASGLITYVIPVYIAEISPKNLRGGLVLVHRLVVCCGISMAFIFGLVTSWRTLVFVGTIPCIIQLLGLFFIPESPRCLVMNSSEEVYEAALRHFRGENTDISQEAAEIKVFTKDFALSDPC